jgi:NADH-quinone oxidoreductase subunit N
LVLLFSFLSLPISLNFTSQIQYFLENIFGRSSLILPEICLSFGLLLFLFVSFFANRASILKVSIYITLLLISLGLTFYISENNLLIFRRLLLFCALLVPLFFPKPSFLKQENYQTEWLFLLLASTLGLSLMIAANDWVTFFVALELSAIASYILVIISWKPESYEGAIKYLLMGLLASAVMIYGVSWLYGFLGSFEWQTPTKIHFNSQILLYVAILMAIAGVLMKISVVPWHIWTPDAYQAAPTPVVAFLATAPKVAGLLALYKILKVYQPLMEKLDEMICFLAIISIVWGNFVALWQKNFKRMLAYSSIAHAGYLLIGVAVGNQFSLEALSFYLLVYIVTNYLLFYLADYYENQYQIFHLEDFKGLGHSDIQPAIWLFVALLSLAGLPPTAGFTAKMLIFSTLWENYEATQSVGYLIWLMVGLLNTVIGLFYYLKIPYYAYLKENAEKNKTPESSLMLAGILSVLLLITLFFFPSVFLG